MAKPGFALSSDEFESFNSWADVYKKAQEAPNKTKWAIAQFDNLPLFFLFFSKVTITGSRHAEESLIVGFPTILTRATVTRTGLLSSCKIYISDSPCIPCDGKHASNDPELTKSDWPVSCTQKIKMLAQKFPGLNFNVYYQRDYRSLDEFTAPRHFGNFIVNVLLNRIPEIFFDGSFNIPKFRLMELTGYLQDFIPGTPITPEMTMGVVAEFKKLSSKDKKDLEAFAFGIERKGLDKTVQNRIVRAILKGLHMSDLKKSGVDLSKSIMARAVSPANDPLCVDNPAFNGLGSSNLTIEPRDYNKNPPNP